MKNEGFTIMIPECGSATLIQNGDSVYHVTPCWPGGIEITIYYPPEFQASGKKVGVVLKYIKEQLAAFGKCRACERDNCQGSKNCDVPREGSKEFVEKFDGSQWYVGRDSFPVEVKSEKEANLLYHG